MFQVRAAKLSDAMAVAKVDVETWRSTYAGLLPDHLLIGLTERQRVAVWTRFISRRPEDTTVAVDAKGLVIGFGSCGAQRDLDVPFMGEVFTLYVHPDQQGAGVGRSLLLALFGRLIRCGLYSSVIWVLKDNPARFFYERVGGKIHARRSITMGSVSVEAFAYGWSDLSEVLRTQAKSTNRLLDS